MKGISLAFLLLMLLPGYSASSALSPDSTACPSFSIQGSYGFIIPHSQAIEDVSGTKPFGFEAGWNKLHTSFNSWKVFHSSWFSGVQLAYYNFQNQSTLGSAYTLTLFAEPVAVSGNRLLFSVRGGAGISAHTKYYDENTNPDNKFFCTMINFQLYVSARLRYRVSERSFISLAGNYNHISNGGIKQPNYGMNFPMVAVGYEHMNNPVPQLKNNYRSLLDKPDKRLFFSVQFLSALKVLDETDQYPEKKVWVAGLNVGVIKPLGHIYSLTGGAELLSDGYSRELIAREGSDTDHKRISLYGGQVFTFGNVLFAQSVGWYVYSPYEPTSSIYQKYELGYRFGNGIAVGVHMKAYLKEADYMGFTVSWAAPFKKNEGIQ